jgi:CDP-diacylglycerol--glycerol-3-phosphate 3-phosphatidyltransferase
VATHAVSIKQKIPNYLTYGRMLAIVLVVASYYGLEGLWHYWVTWSIFAWACVTDFFDGYLARIWGSQSNLGRFLDPIADKLLICVCILMLVGDGRADMLPSIAIFCREMFISGLREFLADKKISVPVSMAGKVKTNVQMVGVGCLLVAGGTPDWWHIADMGRGLYWLAAVLTLFSGWQYLKASWKHL